MCSQKFRKRYKPVVLRDKNDQICTTDLYIHSYILWFSYAFKVCSKSMSEIQYIHPVIVAGAVILHKMFDAGTKHLSATDGELKVFLGRSMWVKKFNLQMTFMCIYFSHYANPPKCIIDTADIRKILDNFYIYFFSQ